VRTSALDLRRLDSGRGDRCWCRSGRRRGSRFRYRYRSRCRLFDRRSFGDDLGGTTTTANVGRFGWSSFDFRLGGWGSRGRTATTPGSRRRRRNSCALLALPTGADTSDLIVAQRTEMAANGDVHLAKEVDHLVTGNPKLACQIMHSKLAQAYSSPS